MEREVKREYTGWRDENLSARHRRWGWNAPAVDVDLFLEYDNGKPAALVEYKRETAPLIDPDRDRNTQALVNQANASHEPAFGVRYAKDFSWWMVTPLNSLARRWVDGEHVRMTEQEWVRFGYRLRGYHDLPQTLRFDEQGRLR